MANNLARSISLKSGAVIRREQPNLIIYSSEDLSAVLGRIDAEYRFIPEPNMGLSIDTLGALSQLIEIFKNSKNSKNK